MTERDELFAAETDREDNILLCEISCEYDKARADVAISSLTELSRSAVSRLCESGAVSRGGVLLDKKSTVSAGDIVEIILPEPEPCCAEPENIPLSIVYEDGDIIVIDKPSGMVVHPSPGHTHGTLVSALLYHCKGELSGIGGVMRPGIVHRIDRQTTGLICVAKNDFAHERLCRQLEDHSMHREYKAIVIGKMKESTGRVDSPLGRSTKDRKKMAIVPGGKRAVTHYTVEEELSSCSVLRLILETGRTHQIRVHMASVGHSVLGDELYGGASFPFVKKHPDLFDGQMLHAEKLILVHPRTGEEMTFTAPLGENFIRAAELLRTTM